MPVTMLVIDYDLSDTQKALTPEDWLVRAGRIAGIDGLGWKYWLRGGDDARGGVYLFSNRENAEQASIRLVDSLNDAGARNVTHRLFEVDEDPSRVTRGTIDGGSGGSPGSQRGS